MKLHGIVCFIIIVSALVLSAGCTGQQAVVPPAPVTTPQAVTTMQIPSTSPKPETTVSPGVQAANPRQLLVDKSWKVISWSSEPDMDGKNASVQKFLAEYQRRANDTFTWYNNGTLAYRYANGTAYTTGTWNLTKNNTALVEKYGSSDGFYDESENEILNLSKALFVIRYPVMVAGKEYFIIETQGV